MRFSLPLARHDRKAGPTGYFVPAPAAAATAMIGALVGWGAPPAASSVTATALSESRERA
jgi:hypothetical protein